ncbi:MAG: hypothetical protein WKF48_05745 [Solirubrobacteraceae bacterium]
MPQKYLVAGDHADVLASGRPIAPGETVAAGAVDLEHPHDRRLMADGVLIDTQPAREGKED